MNFSALPNELVAKIQKYSDFKTIVLMRRTCKRMDSIVKRYKLDKPNLHSLEFSFNSCPNGFYQQVPIHGESDLVLKIQLKDRNGNSRYNKYCRVIPRKYLTWITSKRERVQQTIKKFPCFEQLTVTGAVIDDLFFDDLIAAQVNYSKLQHLYFVMCRVLITPERLKKCLKFFMIVQMDICVSEVPFFPNFNQWNRYLCYGEDGQGDIGLENFENIDVTYIIKFLKIVFNKIDQGYAVPNYIKVQRDILEDSRQRDNILNTLKELEHVNNCTVLVDDIPFGKHIKDENFLKRFVLPFKKIQITKRHQHSDKPMVIVFHLVFYRQRELNERDL